MSMVDTLVSDSANEAGIVATQTLGALYEHQEILVVIIYALFWLVPMMAAVSSGLKLGKNLPNYFSKMPISTLVMGVPAFVITMLAALMHVGALMSVLYWWSDAFEGIKIFQTVTEMLYGPWSSLAMAYPLLDITPISVLLSAVVVQSAGICFLSTYNSVLDKVQKEEVSDMLDKFGQAGKTSLTYGQQISGNGNVLHLGSKSKKPGSGAGQ